MKAMFATESNWDEKDVRGDADSYLAPFMAHDVVMIGEGVRTGYFPLETVLCAAYDQAASGKGSERHAAGDEFNNQPILTIGRLLKSADGEAYQAIKKTREALQMAKGGKYDAAMRELLGAINYTASVALLLAEEAAARRDVEAAAAACVAQEGQGSPCACNCTACPEKATSGPQGSRLTPEEWSAMRDGREALRRPDSGASEALDAIAALLGNGVEVVTGEINGVSVEISLYQPKDDSESERLRGIEALAKRLASIKAAEMKSDPIGDDSPLRRHCRPDFALAPHWAEKPSLAQYETALRKYADIPVNEESVKEIAQYAYGLENKCFDGLPFLQNHAIDKAKPALIAMSKWRKECFG